VERRQPYRSIAEVLSLQHGVRLIEYTGRRSPQRSEDGLPPVERAALDPGGGGRSHIEARGKKTTPLTVLKTLKGERRSPGLAAVRGFVL
jgi:hypothetical protein